MSELQSADSAIVLILKVWAALRKKCEVAKGFRYNEEFECECMSSRYLHAKGQMPFCSLKILM